MSITVTAKPASSPDLVVVVAGHASPRLPKFIDGIVAKVVKGDLPAPQYLNTPDGRWLVVKPETKPWLVGGEPFRLLGKDVVDCLRQQRLAAAVIHIEADDEPVQALAEGLVLADYRFTRYRSGKDAKRTAITVALPGHDDAVARGVAIAGAQNTARDLSDAPPNELNPQTFAERVRRELRGSGLEVKTISGLRELAKAGFPGLCQVGQAGSAEPALVEIAYKPRKTRGKARLALVGKGLTFDSGGISLKPGDKMWEMKADMGGAAAVFAAMKAIAVLAPPVPVTAYLALAENMPDSKAQRPGDIYVTRKGISVHVDNTDAEGRLVLADVLTYACEKGATHLVDVATLTGACMVALGDRVAGLFSRHDDWAGQVRAAGQAVGEELWRLPLHGEYRSLMDHPHADINNIGGRFGGAITAAVFLSEFVDPAVKWAHLDVAGPVIQTGGWRYYAKGMTGFATRSLVRIAEDLGR